MDPVSFVVIVLIAAVTGGLVINTLFAPGREDALRVLTEGGNDSNFYNSQNKRETLSDEERALIRSSSLKSKKVQAVSLREKFFHAGMFSEHQKESFKRLRIIIPVITIASGFLAANYYGTTLAFFTIVPFSIILGYQLPISILDRRIAKRSDEVMYYLPVVIEQIVIGVSSSLDIGPCIQGVIKMADERDNHNAVTELLRHCQNMVRSGVSLEEALHEIGQLSGHTELKHSFMALAQVVKHGGEITKQLQELADAVSAQRETKIESKIKKLELEATGPVGLVFCGFLAILLIGMGAQFMKVFPN